MCFGSIVLIIRCASASLLFADFIEFFIQFNLVTIVFFSFHYIQTLNFLKFDELIEQIKMYRARITHVNFVRHFHDHEILQKDFCSSLILCVCVESLLSDSVIFICFCFLLSLIFSTDLFWCMYLFFNILFVVKI